MGLPAGFAPSLTLGGGPSQAILYGGTNSNNGWTGPFTVGKGSASQSVTPAPINNSAGAGSSPGGNPFTSSGLISSDTLTTLALLAVAFLFFRKKA